MTTKKTITPNTTLYAELYADFSAQCEAAYMEGMTSEERADALDSIKRELSKDPKYAPLVKHDFQTPTTRTRRVSQADLDSIVETHGF